MLNVIMLNVDMQNVIMQNVIMQNVIMLNVVVPSSSTCMRGECTVNFDQKLLLPFCHSANWRFAECRGIIFSAPFLIYNGESQKADAVTFLSHPKDFFFALKIYSFYISQQSFTA